MNQPNVSDYMATRLVTLQKDMNVYFAIGILLKNNISGAPVVDKKNNLLGILSEKDCLRIFTSKSIKNMSLKDTIDLGRGTVEQYMTLSVSTIDQDMDLFTVAEIFIKNHFRRMPVLNGNKLVGQISRRDVLKAIQDITNYNLQSDEIEDYNS